MPNPITQSQAHRPHVVIVGGGFAGLHAARGLRHLPVDVTLIDRRNFHTFQPLLYQVALAVLSPADIAAPLRSILRHQRNTQVLMDEVTAIDTPARRLTLRSGARVPYDYLVLAAGATHSYFGHDEWAAYAPGLKTVEDATEIRRRVLLAFELAERQMLEHGWAPPLNFVVIGGGPTGVELAGAIRDIAHDYMRHDFRHIDPTRAKVLLLDGGPRLLAAYPADLSAKAQQSLEHLGVEVHINCHVTNVGPGWVETGGPGALGRVEAAVILWAAGVQASPLGKMLADSVPADSQSAQPDAHPPADSQSVQPFHHPGVPHPFRASCEMGGIPADSESVQPFHHPGVPHPFRASCEMGGIPADSESVQPAAVEPPAVQLDKRGCVFVDSHLNPAGLPNVFVLGDLAHFEQDGHQIPGVAQPAMQMGDHIARILRADLAGKPRPAFRYFDKGDMATIGRMSAVADVKWPFRAHMSGLPAWLTWITVHIFFLIGFRNRIAVMATWIWTYFTFTRSARLITGDQRLPGWQEQTTAGPANLQAETSPSKAAD